MNYRDYNSSDYFAYKKRKIQSGAEKPKKTISRLNFLFQLFITTFIIMFIIIVVTIMKYSKKMDIEYTKGDLSFHNAQPVNSISGYDIIQEEQKKIDKRLILIQQEENAPSEARIIINKDNTGGIIAPEHIENNKKIEKQEKIEKRKQLIEETQTNKVASAIESAIHFSKTKDEIEDTEKNVTILSKVLIGRYSTFEEAQKMQNEIKAKDSSLSPFVRKTGDVFCVQMGSYQDFSTARKQAQELKNSGYDVWIYQQ